MPKGVECPHAGYVNLALSYADYFDLLPGMDATSLTSSLGYDGSISEMYSAWVSGCAVVDADQGADSFRPGVGTRIARRRGHGALLSTGAADHAYSNPRIGPPLSVVPLCRSGGRSFPQRARGAVDPWPAADHQHLRPNGGEHRHEPSKSAAGRAHYHRLTVSQRHLRHPRSRPTPTTASWRDRRTLHRWGARRARVSQPTGADRPEVHHPSSIGRLYRTGDKCKIDIQARRVHFLGRIDAQLKVRGHRVEAQAVEDILQGQFSEIEAAVLDYQNETLVAFVAAPSLCQEPISGVAPAPTEWAAENKHARPTTSGAGGADGYFPRLKNS